MTDRPYRTANPDLDQRLRDVLAGAGATADVDLLFEILVSGVLLAGDGADRLDLKITNAALKEMREAFRVFAPWRHVPKVTIFGSARTLPDDPLYLRARDLAAGLGGGGGGGVGGGGTKGAAA
ncbi:MAG: Rossman fold protein, TIGR00730 family, partial [Acidimicrobiales bacterium]